MSLDWISALDMCAANGILDYDAPADILGQDPRYVGHPDFNRLPMVPTLLPEGTKLPDEPKTDEFVPQNNNLIENPKWKKWLFGIGATVAIGGSILATLISKGKIKIPTCVKNFGTTVWNAIKAPFKCIGSLFKKAPTPPTP